MTADSPCCIGMIATRISMSVRPARSRAGAVLAANLALGDVEIGDDLDAGDHRPAAARRDGAVTGPATGRRCGNATTSPAWNGSIMDVAGAQLRPLFFQQGRLTARTNRRGRSRDSRQALNNRLPRGSAAPAGRVSFVLIQAMTRARMARSSAVATLILDSGAKNDLCRALRRLVGRIGDREHRSTPRRIGVERPTVSRRETVARTDANQRQPPTSYPCRLTRARPWKRAGFRRRTHPADKSASFPQLGLTVDPPRFVPVCIARLIKP